MPDSKNEALANRLGELNMNGDQLSRKYGFHPSTFGQSAHRDGTGQKTALFLLAAEEQGPEVREGRCLSVADVEPDGTLGFLRRLFGAEHLELRAKIWPADVTRETVASWLVRWGMAADAAAAAELVSSFGDDFIGELAATCRHSSVEGVRLLCARRLGAPVVW